MAAQNYTSTTDWNVRGRVCLFLNRTFFEKNVDPLVQTVERMGFDDFGYIFFRTDYSDDQRWEQWNEQFDEKLEASLAEAAGGERIKDKLLMPMYVNPDLEGASFQQIQQ